MLCSSRAAAACAAAFAALLGCGGGSVQEAPIHGGGGGHRIIPIPADAGPDALVAAPGTGGNVGLGGAGPGSGGALQLPGQTETCHQCEKTACTTDQFIHENTYSYSLAEGEEARSEDLNLYELCYPGPSSPRAQEMPAAGPASGTGITKAELCRKVIDCVHASGCSLGNDGTSNLLCYCGSHPENDCTEANGPCKKVMEAAAEGEGFTQYSKVRINLPRGVVPGYAIAYAFAFLDVCETRKTDSWDPPCRDVCTGAPVAGAAGAGGSGGAPGSAGHGGGGSPAAGSGGSGGSVGSPGTAGQAGSTGNGGAAGTSCPATHSLGPSCEACVRDANAAGVSKCLTLKELTASIEEDPETGDPPTDLLGPDTLPTAAQRDAAYALIARIAALLPDSVRNEKNTANAARGDRSANFTAGLLTLGANPIDLFSGQSLAPRASTAFDAYVAAAVADRQAPAGAAYPHGIAPTATNADIGMYISTNATVRTGVIGLVGNYLSCAFNALPAQSGAACDDCFKVTTTQICATGSGGAGGGGSGGAGGLGGTSGLGGAARGGSGGSSLGGAGGLGGAARGGSGGSSLGGASGFGGAARGGSGGSGGSGALCPDLNHDAILDCQQTLVANPTFDSAVTGWTAETGATAAWNAGAVAVTNTDTSPSHAVSDWTTTGVSQCLAVPSAAAGRTLEVALRTYLRAGQGAGAARFVLDYYTAAGCAGAASLFPYLSSYATATDSWQTLAGTTTQIPAGVTSVAVRLVATKPVAQPSFEALFDDVLVRVK